MCQEFAAHGWSLQNLLGFDMMRWTAWNPLQVISMWLFDLFSFYAMEDVDTVNRSEYRLN